MPKGRWSSHPISASEELAIQGQDTLYAVRLLRDLRSGFVREITDLTDYMEQHHLSDEKIAIERLQHDVRHREKSKRIFIVKAQTSAHAVFTASQMI